jgi:hypothetical protein
MVKNNGIPIEVKKPFETVYEIKNETPSFEEFMENYEADDKVIDSYRDEVEYVNGWASKGSGPCQICDKPEQWRYLYLSCPGVNDEGKACGNPNQTYWYHSTDSGQTEISNRAKIRCSKCYTSAHLSYWRFKCSWHTGEKKYYDTSSLEFRKAITLINGTEPYIGTTMAQDLITYLVHPDHRNEGRIDW